jgi:hypothetical protein
MNTLGRSSMNSRLRVQGTRLKVQLYIDYIYLASAVYLLLFTSCCVPLLFGLKFAFLSTFDSRSLPIVFISVGTVIVIFDSLVSGIPCAPGIYHFITLERLFEVHCFF